MSVQRYGTDPLVYHRKNVTASDTVAVTGAELATRYGRNADWPNTVCRTQGALLMELRAWGNAENKTGTITVVGWPAASSSADVGVDRTPPKGVILFSATIAFGSETTANRNPITGQADAGVTYYEMDTAVAAITGTRTLTMIDSANNRQCRILFDPLGYPLIFAYVTLDGATPAARVDISLRLVS